MIDKEKLTRLSNVLKENLPLGNWKVNLKFISAFEIGEMTGNDTDLACTSYKDRIECVDIYINEDGIYREWDNPEYTLIHEFIHIMYHNVDEHVRDKIDNVKLYTTLEERFINNVSYAMSNLLWLK